MVMKINLASQGYSIWTTAFIDPAAPHHVHGTSTDMKNMVQRGIIKGDGACELLLIGTLKLRVILSSGGLLELHLRDNEGARTTLSERRLQNGGHHIDRGIYDSQKLILGTTSRRTIYPYIPIEWEQC